MAKIMKLIDRLKQLLNKYKRTNHITSLIDLLMPLLNKKLRLTQLLSRRQGELLMEEKCKGEPLFMIEEAEVEEEPILLLEKEKDTENFYYQEENKKYVGLSTKSKDYSMWRFSSSISASVKKSFDQTLAENQMEKIFSVNTRQKKILSRSTPFELSFEKLRERILDSRLSNSSMLDYICQCFMSSKKKQRCKSLTRKQNKEVKIKRNIIVSIDDFKLVRTIKSGKILLVEKKDNNELYTMETLRQSKPNESLEGEFSLMKFLNSDHVIRLCHIFPEKEYAIFLAEYVEGIDLGSFILKHGTFAEEVARKYLVEIIKGLECIHSNGLVHKSFGLDNIILGNDGKIRLTKCWSTGNFPDLVSNKAELLRYTTPTLIGEYKTSMLNNWWALGIMAYIMMFAVPPFTRESPEQLYQNLVRYKATERRDALEFVKGLATPNIRERLGRNGSNEIKAHPFFKDIIWD
jgi:hypothetical protein